MKNKTTKEKEIKQKPRKMYLTQKGENLYQETHTFYKFNFGQYTTVTTNDKNLIFGNLVSIYKDYSL
jgi:uncharacterized protein YlaI